MQKNSNSNGNLFAFIFIFPVFNFFDAKMYKLGRTTSVSIVDVIRPPIATVANGRCTSAPALPEKKLPLVKTQVMQQKLSSVPVLILCVYLLKQFHLSL